MGATAWEKDHVYKKGALIIPDQTKDHYYQAESDATSGTSQPTFPGDGTTIPDADSLAWHDRGKVVRYVKYSTTCSNISPSQPLVMNRALVLAIDMNGIPSSIQDRFKVLNLNITNQQGAPLNPTPIRPGLTAATATGQQGLVGYEASPQKVYYLTWPNLLSGDTIPTVSVNLIYTPVAPALPWVSGTFYPAGSIVIPNATDGTKTINGHYFLALNSGISTSPPDFNSAAVRVPTFSDPGGQGLTWKEMGLTTLYPSPPTWQPRTKYAKASRVIPSPQNGYYYEAETEGVSGQTAPPFPLLAGDTIREGSNLSWINKGLTTVNPATTPSWQPGIAYAKGAFVIPPNPPNGHYYETQTSGVSGPNPPPFPTIAGDTVIEASSLTWVDVGPTLPASTKNFKAWAANTAFFVGDVIQDASSGHYYSVMQAGISGVGPPSFSVPAPGKVGESVGNGTLIQWEDLGTTLPASVSSVGVPPSDQTVSLLTYTLPQVHALSYFNIATGVVVSSIKSPTFLNSNPSTASMPSWKTVSGPLTIDPILALSVYIKPIDAERLFQKSDLIPAPTMAFSLSSPTSNFYFGGSSEFFFRNIQLTYGFSLSRISSLLPASEQLSATTPATRQVFAKGGFIGVSFNILGFVQSVFHP
jgi:hypothetical protein